MARTISLADADSLLLRRRDLLERGMTDRAIAAAVASRSLHRVRRGWFVAAIQWGQLWPEGQLLLHVVAVARDARSSMPVFSHTSAAVLHGLPLYRTEPGRVDVRVANPRHIRSLPDVFRHEGDLPEADITSVGGIRTTCLARTAVDLARTLPIEAAVAATDAAMRIATVRGRHTEDAELREAWNDAVWRQVRAARGQRGIRQGRWVIGFADGRAQLPGESISRLQLYRLGVRDVDLQARVPGPDGRDFWVDFGLGDYNAFGEFDGEGKYTDAALRDGLSLEQILLEEKRREDWIRGSTGRRVVRWGSRQASSPATLASHLRAQGVRTPLGE